MEENKKKELSYDELKNIAGQLSQQNQQLNMTNIFKRMDYLFKVLELKDCFDSEFVITCSDEIKELMTPPVEHEEDRKEA